MDSDRNWIKRKEFRALLRSKLVDFMASKNYQLSYDNSLLNKDEQQNLVFKLVFQGIHTIEVSNVCYRDYTQYFNFYIDSKEVFNTDIDFYDDINEAYEKCKKFLEINIRHMNTRTH